jgi:hypothetical protein
VGLPEKRPAAPDAGWQASWITHQERGYCTVIWKASFAPMDVSWTRAPLKLITRRLPEHSNFGLGSSTFFSADTQVLPATMPIWKVIATGVPLYALSFSD